MRAFSLASPLQAKRKRHYDMGSLLKKTRFDESDEESDDGA
jgi:hypothetical protein